MIRHSIDLDMNTVGLCLEITKCKGTGFYASSKHVCYYHASKCEEAIQHFQRLRTETDDYSDVYHELNFVSMTHKIKTKGDFVYGSLVLDEEKQIITYQTDVDGVMHIINLKELPSNPVLHAKGVCNDSDGYYRGFLIWG
jgi:hypothetical protein